MLGKIYVYVLCIYFVVPSVLMNFRRPTGWHGESGAAQAGGHIAVDFALSNGEHVTTHHVYPTDKGYYNG
jgi:hypothetical protein